MNKKQIQNMLASYGRSLIAAATALYLAGVTDPADLAYSLLAAIIPVALRAVNPNDPAFGLLPDPKAVEAAAKAAKPMKKPAAKKAVAAKKPAPKKK
jgi:hydroxymethylpyrimidine/phosphomethylpyrimidine kinase